MSAQALNILFPSGRLVQGDLYTPQTKDQQGNPLVVKTGANAGKPTQKFFFAVAIPKAPGETHWANTAWGQQIWAAGHTAWPQGQAQSAAFAWKIEDGDSAIPNKVGRKNCDREGFPGNWIVNFSSSFAPKIYTANGEQAILEVGAVKLGYYVEVFGTVTSNENASNPGMYVNHSMVALRGYGAEIRTGPDPKAAGFGRSALPVGASAAPVGAASFPAAAAAPAPAAPPPPAAAPATVAAPAPTAVAPAPSFIAPPAPGGVPAAPPPPAAAPVGPQMTAKAAGQSYAAFIANGWTDANLRAHGYMV